MITIGQAAEIKWRAAEYGYANKHEGPRQWRETWQVLAEYIDGLVVKPAAPGPSDATEVTPDPGQVFKRVKAALEAGPTGSFTTTRGTDAAYDFTADNVRALLADLERLRAELADSKQDAARYRFIRDADRSDEHLGFDSILCYAMESLDEAVDAAMRKEGGE